MPKQDLPLWIGKFIEKPPQPKPQPQPQPQPKPPSKP